MYHKIKNGHGDGEISINEGTNGALCNLEITSKRYSDDKCKVAEINLELISAKALAACLEVLIKLREMELNDK